MTHGLHLPNLIRKPRALDKNKIRHGKQGTRLEREVERQNRKKQEEKQAMDLELRKIDVGFLSMNMTRINSLSFCCGKERKRHTNQTRNEWELL